MTSDGLKVIALISGGKDSFFSALHCSLHGHSLVALANLFPVADTAAGGDEPPTSETQVIQPSEAETAAGVSSGADGAEDDADLNSFMYQTVGHQLIPLYAAATGLPLYRQPIRGGAQDEGRDYDGHGTAAADADVDETESMVPLLRAVMRDHPEANALCAGAILSTYQRTRVESVALRLGLAPLAYLWKFPVLPPLGPGLPREDAQLLLDMAAAGLDARIIKVASAGLDEDFLWERVSSMRGVARIKKGLRRFGTAEGSVLGEGGEFETIVVDGPASLFKRRIVVPDGETRVVKEGGGTSWLSIRKATLEDKSEEKAEKASIRVPELLDQRFQAVVDAMADASGHENVLQSQGETEVTRTSLQMPEAVSKQDLHWTVFSQHTSTVLLEEETSLVVDKIRRRLDDHPTPLPTTAITNTIIILRRMADFPVINAIYAQLFRHPNPPSRVTISCGDLLPEGSNIAIHVTVRGDLEPRDRKGLHVQSRSYWAPANIGPYSQAIDVPLFGAQVPGQDDDGTLSSAGARVLAIAGQIPLWPATMVIPPEADITLQIVLSLQHLWRIGVDQKVQLWSSAVAYFPRASSSDDMQRQSSIAARAWEQAHTFSKEEEDDDEAGPDLWDRTHNPQYMTFGGADASAGSEGQLPDWNVFRNSAQPVPPFFAVEVEELPRQSGVEWHAHAGLANLEDASVEVVEHVAPSMSGARVSHTVVAGVPVRSIVSLEASEADSQSPGELMDAMERIYAESVGIPVGQAISYLAYLQVPPETSPVAIGSGSMGVVPCRSIWSARGRPVAALGLFSALSSSRRGRNRS
ncbi:hypothetical protein F5X68DRAFT_188907 [Plectosphaerella plurivora]|uniref:Diphthine--ammonia ligase n=1 Tax=Plectosphaerella plurivora TaxID=936078 RepID=A0A9P9ADV9_9PEZI|nr:hypothetical protein F5X68DRAFT_188907 [Plectosphaerella plurivora]